jgi:riboflavin synthase
MFTGLIETTGTVLSLSQSAGAMRIVVAAPQLAGRLRVGDSVAVNGVCLTALDVEAANGQHPGRFAADLAAETVERTTLAALTRGSLVNLELPTPAGAPLGGHVVQGHVDATATLISLVALHPESEASDWRLTLELPHSLLAYVVPQGSITVDGISLTVARVNGALIEIAIIPHTFASTNLHSLLAGARVNIETDVLGRYAEQRTRSATGGLQELTVASLIARGY